ncbi:MAG: hypothetical protein IJQ75_01400, partial [Synergistaceae bacterium]|nr:hypothetical protein [Synergistaceae bacterium]
QQSRIACVRLACEKAETRLLRGHPEILAHEFPAGMGRPERDNAISSMLTGDFMSADEKRAFISQNAGASLGSDAFFPFPDSIDRAKLSGVKYVAQPGGSIRDDLVIKACDDYGMAMVMTGRRLFHH